MLGHVYLTNRFQPNVNEITSMRARWIQVRDMLGIKAFVEMYIGPNINWGVRNIFLCAGLGGMKPNITIIGFYNLEKYRDKLPVCINFESDYGGFFNQPMRELPTDHDENDHEMEHSLKVEEWVSMIEDLSLLNSNVAVAKGFPKLEMEGEYIDLYPIQMMGELDMENKDSLLMSNFDTCTLILQLGAILSTVPDWKKFKLRIIVFVENEMDVQIERNRVSSLLEILRIKGEIVVLCLKRGGFRVYDYLSSKGRIDLMDPVQRKYIDDALKDDVWWKSVKNKNKNLLIPRSNFINDELRQCSKSLGKNFTTSRKPVRRFTFSKMNQMGVSYGKNQFVVNSFKDARERIDNDDMDDSDAESVVSAKRGAFSASKMPHTKVGEQDRSIDFEHEPDLNFEDEAPDDAPDEDEYDDDVEFGQLSRRAQLLCVNELMRSQCGKKGRTALVFTTLPGPESGAHQHAEASLEYAFDLALWGERLPPMLFVSARTVTVTANL